jgi:hypothetical protein
MQHIVSFNVGDIECGNHEVFYVVDVASKDDFLLAYMIAVDESDKLAKLESDLQKKYDNAVASSDQTKIQLAWDARVAFTAKHRRIFTHSLVVNGLIFEHFREYDSELMRMATVMPEIYTLEEWFERHRPAKFEG